MKTKKKMNLKKAAYQAKDPSCGLCTICMADGPNPNFEALWLWLIL